MRKGMFSHLRKGSMTLDALCAAPIEYSDNAAGNLLLQTIEPNRAPVLIAVYLADSTASVETLNEAFVETARMIAGMF
jgi:beta-lactamase class A